MKKLYLLWLLLGISFVSQAQLSVSVPALSFCEDTNSVVTVAVTYSDGVTTYLPGNTFIAQLSDPGGSFANAITIGQVSSTAGSGTISAQLYGLANGTGYRIRVVSTNPAITGTDNGSDITISQPPYFSILPQNPVICQGGQVQLATSLGTGVTVDWSPGALTGTSVSVSPMATTTYTATATNSAGCSTTAQRKVVVTAFQEVFRETFGTLGGAGMDAAMYQWLGHYDNSNLYIDAMGVLVRNVTGQSTGYPGASGGSNIFFDYNNGTYPSRNFTITVPNSPGYTNLALSYGIKKSSAASNGSQLVVEYSSDGTNYTPLFPPALPTGPATQNNWYHITSLPIPALPAQPGSSITIRFRQTVSNMQFQVDDIVLSNGDPVPVITSAGTSASFCLGNTLALTASPAAGYSWSNGVTSQINSINQPGIYSVTVTDANGCSATSAPVTITSTPGAISTSIISNSPVCSGQQLTFSATGPSGATYSWVTPAGTLNGQVQNIPNPTTANSGAYTVFVSMAGCTGAPAGTTLSVLPGSAPPAPMISNNGPLCAGSTLLLSANSSQPGVTYTWTFGGATNYTGSVITIPNTNQSHSGIYSVVAVNSSGCVSTPGVSQVTISPVPATPQAVSTSPVCEGQFLGLSATSINNGSYFWTGPDNFTGNQPVENIPNVTLAAAGTYTVNVVENGCVSAPAYTTVQVNPTPVAIISNNSPVCVGETVQFSAGTVPGATYTLSGPNAYNAYQQNPAIPNATQANDGLYQLTVVLNGCVGIDFTDVSVVTSPPPIWTSTNLPLCPGENLMMNTWGSANQTFTWTGPNNFSATGNIVNIPNLQPSDYGSYTVSSGTGACASANIIQVGSPPAPNVSGSAQVCPGGFVFLLADSLAGNATGYSWTGPNGFTSSLISPTIPNATPANSGAYSVYMLFNTCVSEPGIFQVSVAANQAVTATNNGPLNQGGTLVLTGIGTAGNYTWTGPNNYSAIGYSPYIQNAGPANAGTYSVTLVSPGCTTVTATTTVLVNQMNMVSGLVYNDANNNGARDAGEQGKPNVMINVQPGGYVAYTNNQGEYTTYVPDGSFTVTVMNLQPNQTASPGSHVVSFTGTGQSSLNNNFGVHTNIVQDMSVWITELWNASPGFTALVKISCENEGSAAATGTIRFLPDASVTILANTSGGYALSGDTLVWNFTNLQPNAQTHRYVYMSVPVSAPLGSVLPQFVKVTPVSGDVSPLNNAYALNQTVTGSWDPNDKQVHPAGNISTAQVAAGQELYYTVRFQNTGTAPAVNVMLLDTLSDNLDLSSFQMLSSSHNFVLNMRNPGVLEWKFNNIMLPDSNTNEPESHGYVQYSIKPLSSLTVGDEIANTAHIYFDFNEAVVTNTTVTAVGVVSAPGLLIDAAALHVYPNPNNGNFRLKLSDCKPGKVQIKLLNLLGQEVYAEAASTNNTYLEHQLKLHNVPDGMYMLQVEQEGNVITKRVIKQK